MKNDYSIDDLIEIFTDHVEKTEKEKQFPNNDFNICKAFLCFAKEIKALKDRNLSK